MATAITMVVTLVPETCCQCGTPFGMTDSLMQQRRRDGEWFYCPAGHQQHYTETEAQRLKKQLESKERTIEFERNMRRSEEAAHRATKGQLTKLKNRVHAGVCPHCNRTFGDVARHMKSKHPEAE